MEELRRALKTDPHDLTRQYVMAIMATGNERSQRGRDLLALNKISLEDAIFKYHLPKNYTKKDLIFFARDVRHYVGTPRQTLLNKVFRFKSI